MKIKVGDIVKNEVTKSKIPKVAISTTVGKSRTWLDNILSQEEIEVKYIIAIGKAIRVDFGFYFPELKKAPEYLVEEPEGVYASYKEVSLRDQLIEMQSKYIALLEEHARVLREIKNV